MAEVCAVILLTNDEVVSKLMNGGRVRRGGSRELRVSALFPAREAELARGIVNLILLADVTPPPMACRALALPMPLPIPLVIGHPLPAGLLELLYV